MIPYGRHHIDEEDIAAVTEVLRNGALTQGPAIEMFECAIAEYVGAKYAVAVSSGTAGLHIASLVAGMSPGKKLITSPITFVASANAALYAGGSPLFVDVEPETINMSTVNLSNALSKNPDTRVIMPVHFAGLPCDMMNIAEAAKKTDAVVIEDAAHALGAQYTDGSRVGCCKDSLMTVFSFHPVKAIAAGEGGMVTTNDELSYRQLLRLRSHGINKLDDPYELPQLAEENSVASPWYYEMQTLGFNYRITDIQSALALSQLKKLDKFISRRKNIVEKYDQAFSDFENCRPAQLIQREHSAHHLYVLRIDFKKISINRSELMLRLREKGIITQVHYIPVPSHPYYRTLGFNPEDYINSQEYYAEALSIPLYYDLSDQEQEYVIDSLRSLLV
jgi:UDP-4-amino-4,6-dideoxy-N-acetyl-beta-L-altrosamine transaminase